MDNRDRRPERPDRIKNDAYRFDAFNNGKPLLNKKKGHLPAMGWNSWNAFGSGNTEALTKMTADRIVELGLDKLGYRYVVLDDGCYRPERVEGRLANEPAKFPSGFKALADYVHAKGLKYGMYNDIGTNLCAGALVGTCGYEDVDAESYVDWDVDFLKVDNCYYLWDNATFSNPQNVRYVYTPGIMGLTVEGQSAYVKYQAVSDGIICGEGSKIFEDTNGKYIGGLGTFDGTGPWASPVGPRSTELVFRVNVPEAGQYKLTVECIPGCEDGKGTWLQLAIGEGEASRLIYDDFVTERIPPMPVSKDKAEEAGEQKETEAEELISLELNVEFCKGENKIRIMNHRRQENTLNSYARLLEELNRVKPDHDITYSICEWGKTQPQNWGYKVGDSWRILNDITFRVGSDGDPGYGAWRDDYTPSVTSQYNKAVIMDEFSGLDKGWNDPDMLMIGMNGLSLTAQRTHMTMWCMMNSPLMLGIDFRRVEKGDDLYNIIADQNLIALNQDELGIQAKRVFCSLENQAPDKTYVTNIDRVDILAKPLSDGAIALSFINVSEADKEEGYSIDLSTVVDMLGDKMANKSAWQQAVQSAKQGQSNFDIEYFEEGKRVASDKSQLTVNMLEACESLTIKVSLR